MLIDDNVEIIPHIYNDRFISDNITDFDKWVPSSPVIISAQTGSGKTSFIKDILIDSLWKRKNKPSFLLLSNRTALTSQIKKSYLNILLKHSIISYTDFIRISHDILNNTIFELGPLYITSYHTLYHNKILDTKKFDYIICDEAHFFVSDSPFNKETDEILEYIILNAQSSVRIYMSATIEEVLLPIILEENRKRINEINLLRSRIMDEECNIITNINDMHLGYYNRHNDNLQLIEKIKKDNKLIINLYLFKRDYSYISNIYEYKFLEEIIDIISKNRTINEQWIIFVSNKTNGKRFKDDLSKIKRDCVFLSRESVENDPIAQNTYYNIINNECCDSSIIITTAILDNGINIRLDKRIKRVNVVIDTMNKTQFLQVLGRIRCYPKEFNLYVPIIGFTKIKTTYCHDMANLIKCLQCDILDFEAKKSFFDPSIHKLTKDSNVYTYNKLFIYYLIHSILEMHKMSYEELNIDVLQNDISFLRMSILSSIDSNNDLLSNVLSGTIDNKYYIEEIINNLVIENLKNQKSLLEQKYRQCIRILTNHNINDEENLYLYMEKNQIQINYRKMDDLNSMIEYYSNILESNKSNNTYVRWFQGQCAPSPHG